MAGDRVDIEINDKIDNSVVSKLRAIVNEATQGHAAVRKLKQAVDSINARAFNTLATAASKLTSDIDKQAIAQARLRTETNRATLTAAKAATEQQRLATETERTNQAAARAAASQAAQATAQQRAAQAATQAAAAEQRLTLAREAAQNRAAAAAAKTAAAQQVAAAATQIATNAGVRNTASARQQAFAMQQLIFQLNDVGVSLASGQKPMTVLLQQGSQIATIFPPGTNALAALSRMLGQLFLKFLPLIAIIGAVGGAFAIFTNEVRKFTGNTDIGFGDVIAASFQVIGQRIADVIKQVPGLSQAFDAAYSFIVGGLRNLIVGSAVLWNFLFGFVDNGVKQMANGFNIVFNGVIEFIEGAVNIAIGGINILIDGLNAIPGLVGAKLIDPIKQANFDGAKRGLYELKSVTDLWGESVIKANQGVDKLFADIANQAAANAVAEANKKRAEELGKVNAELDREIKNMRLLSDARTVANRVDQIANKFAEDKIPLTDAELAGIRSKIQAIQSYASQQKAMDRIVQDALGPQEAYNDTVAAASDLVRRRVINEQQQAQAVAQAARALALANDPMLEYNEGVQEAIKLSQYFGDELTAQTALQRELNRAKIDGREINEEAILAEQRQLIALGQNQAALQNAYTAITGPQKQYTANVLAATQLIGKFGITEQQVADYIAKTRFEFEESQDPMRAYNREVAQATTLAMSYGDNTAVLTAQFAAYNAEMQRTGVVVPFATFQMSAQGQLIASNTQKIQALTKAQSDFNAIIQPQAGTDAEMVARYTAMYDYIEQLRQADLMKEGEYVAAKMALDQAYTRNRLEQASNFFGEFVGLQRSGNKKIAAIGKAAAIAQAVIDGALAAQKALAAYPPPFNYVAAAGVAAVAAVNVATIKSQGMGNFKDGGQFTVGGRAGVDANNINMNVTRGERVTIETQAQQRANDRANPAVAASPNVSVPVKVINVIDPEEALNALGTPEGEAVVLNILRRNPDAVKQAAQG